MDGYGYSMHLCSVPGCRKNGVNDCFTCHGHFCDSHMLQTRLDGTHIGSITVEACAECTSRAVELYTSQGAYMTSWRRKASLPLEERMRSSS